MGTHDKILPLSQLAERIAVLKKSGSRVVMCHGVFDLLHPGHIRHFEEAKAQGDVLVVTLTRDSFVNKGPGRPAFSESLRAESLAALQVVDFVAINDTPTAVEAILALKPDLYVKGQDYEDKAADVTHGIYAEEEAIRKVGGKLYITHDINFSSTQILNSFFSVYPERAKPFLDSYRQSHSSSEMLAALERLKSMKVLLIGDAIVDEYVYCQPLGKSPKETIVSTRYLNEEAFPGGILACANHIAEFCGGVGLVTVLGEKDTKRSLIEQQLSSKVEPSFFYRPDSPTTIKRRYVEPAFLTKMFQLTYLDDTDLPASTLHGIVSHLKERIEEYDLVFVADYGHGMMVPEIRKILCEQARYLALNVQTNSANQGYNLVTKYPTAHYICIDEPELRLAMQAKYIPIKELILEFSKKYPNTLITITRGHNGSVTSFEKDGQREFFEFPSLSNKIVDRVGAGDAYFALTSLLAASGAPPELLGFLGNAAGAMAVEVVCNRTSTKSVALNKFIKALLG